MAATVSRKNATTLAILGTLIFLHASVLGGITPMPVRAPHLSQPLLEVWSETYRSNNITDLSLTSGEFTIEVNVTETPTINTYGFFLEYGTSYLVATKAIIKEGTFFGDCVPCFFLNDTSTPGVVRVAVSVTGANARGGNGTLAFITFQVVGIGATPLHIRDDELFLGQVPVAHNTQDGLFRNSEHRPPTAQFTHSPTTPFQGNITTFDASGSTDPDGDETIVSYFWRWGDDTGTSTTDNPVITHVFLDRNGDLAYGNFTVTLRVTDDTGLTDTTSALITVKRVPLHDVGISLAANLLTANPGQIVTLSVSVTNRGTFAETTQLRVYAGSTLIDTRPGISLSPGQTQPFEIEWDTTGVAPDVYRITANVTAVPDETSTENNSASTFVSIVASATGLSASLIVGSGVGATALIALAIFLLRRRKATRAEN